MFTISIHAPARGATQNATDLIEQGHISIHAPARGATIDSQCVCLIGNTFQSTLPRGERQDAAEDTPKTTGNFNPRSREGSDIESEVTVIGNIDFNPRSREGSDADSW